MFTLWRKLQKITARPLQLCCTCLLSCCCTTTHLNRSTKSSTTTPSLASAAAVPTSRAALRSAFSGADSDSRRLQQRTHACRWAHRVSAQGMYGRESSYHHDAGTTAAYQSAACKPLTADPILHCSRSAIHQSSRSVNQPASRCVGVHAPNLLGRHHGALAPHKAAAECGQRVRGDVSKRPSQQQLCQHQALQDSTTSAGSAHHSTASGAGVNTCNMTALTNTAAAIP